MAITSKAFKTFAIKETETKLLQSNISDAINPILKTELIDGRLITSLIVGTSATAVNHGLNRKANGYIVVSSSVAANFFDNVPSADTKSFNLTASAATTVSLWVF